MFHKLDYLSPVCLCMPLLSPVHPLHKIYYVTMPHGYTVTCNELVQLATPHLEPVVTYRYP